MPVNGSVSDTIAISDRGFAYGDGLFETILIHHHQPILLSAHLDRLQDGASRLGIPLDRDALEQELKQFIPQYPEQGVVKIIVTRGVGGRGYRPIEGHDTTRVFSVHPQPDYSDDLRKDGVDLFVCNQRLSIQPALAGIKHLNRLEQVLASQEWPDGDFMEGVMLDMHDNVTEGTRSNIFWAESGQLYTPSLDNCGVAGIMRNYLLKHIPQAREISDCSLDRLLKADEIFICNSVFGVWPVKSVLAHGKTSELDVRQPRETFFMRGQDLFNNLLNSDASE